MGRGIIYIYICEAKELEAGSCGRISRAPPAELEFLETVDEIEVLRLRGAPAELQILDTVDEIEVRRLRGASGHRTCQRNRASGASRRVFGSEIPRSEVGSL